MSRRRKTRGVVEPGDAAIGGSAADGLRRTLVALGAALLVARPLAPGEDPGMLGDAPSPAGVILAALWLAGAAGWAGWRVWARRAPWYAGAADLALAAAEAVVAVSAAFVAPYKHPAWLIAGEWLGLLAAFCLLRQLAVSPGEQHGFVTALLATAVALAAEAVVRRLAVPYSASFGGADSATFAHADGFAAYLSLLVPVLAAALVACLRRRASGWLLGMVGLALLVVVAALVLTGSRAAGAAVALVGMVAAAVAGRGWVRTHPAAVATAVLLAAAFVAAAVGGEWLAGEGERLRERAGRLAEVWSTTVRAAEGGAGWGVGPGNFGRAYLRYRDAASPGVPDGPQNFALELWADAGPLALFAVLAALTVFFGRVLRRPTEEDAAREPAADGAAPDGPRWEFTVGGMLGLALGFALHAGGLRGREELIAAGAAAAVRSLAWFAAFAVLERVSWTARDRARALAAGAAAFLLTTSAAPGFGYPSAAVPFWAAVAVGLNATGPRPNRRLGDSAAARYLAFPLLAGFAALFALSAAAPVVGSAAARGRARAAYRALETTPPADPDAFLAASVLVPLKEAARADPHDARTWADLARCYRRRWELNSDPADPKKDRVRTAQALGALAVKSAQAAEGLDPSGPEGYEANYEMLRRFGDYSAARADRARKEGDKKEKEFRASAVEQYRAAARAVATYLPHDPTNARLHYRLADAAFRAGDKALGRAEAAEAERLDALTIEPDRRLTDAERRQVREWRGAQPPG